MRRNLEKRSEDCQRAAASRRHRRGRKVTEDAEYLHRMLRVCVANIVSPRARLTAKHEKVFVLRSCFPVMRRNVNRNRCVRGLLTVLVMGSVMLAVVVKPPLGWALLEFTVVIDLPSTTQLISEGGLLASVWQFIVTLSPERESFGPLMITLLGATAMRRSN